jgi:serine/threonine protein kinase
MSHTHSTATSCLRQLQASMAERMPVMAHTEWATEWDSHLEEECLQQDRVNEDNYRLQMETAVEELSHGAGNGSLKKLLSRPSVINANTRLRNTIRNSDIWSLGCVMSEVLVWLIYGRSNQDKDDSSAQHATLVRNAELRRSSLLKRALMFERTLVPDRLDSDVDKQLSWCAKFPASSSSFLSSALGSTSILGMPPRNIPVRPVITADFQLRNAMTLGRKDACGNEHLASALKLL